MTYVIIGVLMVVVSLFAGSFLPGFFIPFLRYGGAALAVYGFFTSS